MGITMDWTIQFSDLLLIGGGVFAFIKMFLMLRDTLRDLVRMVGTDQPRTGLIGKMGDIQDQVNDHHTWLVRAGLDRRARDRSDEERRHR